MNWRGHIAAGLTRRLFGASAQVWLAPVVARALPGIGIVLATSLAAILLFSAATMKSPSFSRSSSST
ncbi:MAG TPA: hypothetical protein PLL33_09740, partial [Paracoccus sp. (in: a-proteobacteria)]|nr:hypothetical protein [Paracoccus sp. (in: a-proteobacteria)]